MIHDIVKDAAGRAKALEEAELLLSSGVRDDETNRVRAADADAVLGEGWPEVLGVRRMHAEEPSIGTEQGGAALVPSAVRQEQTLGERVSAVLDDANLHLLERPTLPIPASVSNEGHLQLMTDDR